jgi:hypothetical protein
MINCTYSNGVKPPNVTVISPPVDNELLGTSGVSARGKPTTTDSDGGATVVGVVVLGTELSVGGSEIVKERMTSTASAYVALPAALAVNVQVPTVSIVTSSPATVQTSSVVDVSTTERFESDVVVTTKGVDENSRSVGPVNEMVWAVTGLTTVDAGDDAVVVDPFVAVVVNV